MDGHVHANGVLARQMANNLLLLIGDKSDAGQKKVMVHVTSMAKEKEGCQDRQGVHSSIVHDW